MAIEGFLAGVGVYLTSDSEMTVVRFRVLDSVFYLNVNLFYEELSGS